MKSLTAILLCLSMAMNCVAQANRGNQFKVRYNGGTTATTLKAEEWDNVMTITIDSILLTLKNGQGIVIDPKRVKSLSYGRRSSRNIKGYAAAAILIHPLFGLGMLKKNKQHFIGIAYENADGSKGAVLLQAKNNRYRSLLETLKAVT